MRVTSGCIDSIVEYKLKSSSGWSGIILFGPSELIKLFQETKFLFKSVSLQMNTSDSSSSSVMTANSLLDRPNNLNRRKFSFPATLHSTNLLGSDISTLSPLANSSAISARRRLSNVSDVVTRKLSNTIGWKSPQIPAHELITQGKCLCGQYIRSRLKRAGVFNRRLMGLQRMRSIVGTTTPTVQIMREVFPALSFVGEELERMHPRIYSSVARQISRTPDLQSPENTAVLLGAIARELFKTDITWGKVGPFL